MAAKDLEKAEEQGLTEFFKLTSKINTSNMMCFDFDGKIKKYSSPEEMIEEFYPKRLASIRNARHAFLLLLTKRAARLTDNNPHRTSSPTNFSYNSRSCRTRRALCR
jgi:DNA topoisomerase-2